MVIRTFLDKNNTIVYNNLINTARNPVTELFYGGEDTSNMYSRFLLHFDETKLVSLYNDGTFTDLTKLQHILKFTNTGTFDQGLINRTYESKDRTCSFDLIVFKISQDWDEGVGYDFANCNPVAGDTAISSMPSNWSYAQTGINWINGNGVYSGSPSGITITSQHFDIGNENLEVDISSYVNGILTGDTNYGLGIAYANSLELTNTSNLQYVGFFTRHTQTFYEPYVETIYSNYIQDDRNNFFLDKPNKLYLYVNTGGKPTNLDVLPSVDIYDQNEELYSAITQVTQVTKGVYSIDLLIPTTSTITDDYIFSDVWTGILINGIARPDITLSFELMDSMKYYNIGDTVLLSDRVAVSVAGINSRERIVAGDIRKVIVSTRAPYTIDQTKMVSSLKYRLYVKEGRNEVTVTDFEQVEIASNYNYFLLDTGSLLPNDYFLDIQVECNQEVSTLKNVINFTIVSDSNYRIN